VTDVLLLCGDVLNVVIDAVTCNNSLVKTMFITATIRHCSHVHKVQRQSLADKGYYYTSIG